MAEYWTCSECGKVFSDEAGIKEVTDTSALVIAATGHSWDEGTVTTEPTCTEAGVKTYTCTRCGEAKTEEVAALGHDWDAWETVTEATEEADGLERRVCQRCGEVEERIIPHLVVEYREVSGDGSTYTKGSGEDLTFVFKRNVNDDTAYDHFTGILVDDTAVDADGYAAEAGSVVVTLKASYLETLATGSHTLTAQFENGNDPTAGFTVKAKDEAVESTPSASPKKPSSTSPTQAAAPALPKTGDPFAPLAGLMGVLAGCGIALVLAGRRMQIAGSRRTRR